MTGLDEAQGVSVAVADRAEQRYIALAGLARRLASTRDWSDVAGAIAASFGDREPASVRLWAMTAEGLRELARHPVDADLPPGSSLELARAASASEPVESPEGTTLVGLHADGVTFGVLETCELDDREVVEAAAPMIASRLSALAGRGVGDVPLAPHAIDDTSDISTVIANFAHQAKRLLDHDRLSVYLLTNDGRAFERFAVATSGIIPGEGVLIPFEDVGLRHIVLTNRPLVSSDLGADPRLAGAEDRVISRAGFHGLLSVPLRHRGRPFGVLNFVSRHAGFYRNEDLPIAEQIADQIAAFVENLQVQRRMQTFVRLEATERERARVVRDLYQEVSKAVAEISESAAAIERRAGKKGGPTKEKAQRIREIAEHGLADMRRAIVDLDPPEVESGGLAEMIDLTLERFRAQTGCDAALQIDGDATAIPASVARPTYRIVQEALMNARLHADAANVDLRLRIERDLVLEISDDGCGFDRASTTDNGLGFRHMRERTESLGGFLTIQSAPGEGTSIRLTVPAVREAPEPAAASTHEFAAVPSEGTMRIFVAEANVLLRGGLCRLVEGEEQMRVVGEAASVDEAKRQMSRLHPDVILFSTALGNGDPGAMISAIHKGSPSSAVLAVSHGDFGRDLELIESGATGVIHLPIESDGVAQAIRAVAAGNRILGGSQGEPADAQASGSLTARERSILGLVAIGQTNAQIGRNLYLATKTVERQVATIVRKLNAKNRAHAAAIAVARRIVELPGELT